MREKLIRFMQGRYGTDQFSRFLLGAAVVCLVLSLFIQRNLVVSHSASDCLLLFPYVFQEYPEAVCGKSEIPADDGGNPQKMGHMEAGYDGAQNASYL